ncbi:MAG: molybdopterin molybdotransferase MoeA [Spirochaetes bacterium]|nr:molybdopterin molybdotransferase MoeA [Spirochaetota bacterium]
MPDGMIPWNEALELVLSHTPVLGTEETGLFSLYGRVLSEDVRSDMDIPPFRKAAMDGYAVSAQDCVSAPVTLLVRMTLPAGSYSGRGLARGEAAKIMTGAPVPDGADSVVMVEHTRAVEEDRVLIQKRVTAGQHVCQKGEDVTRGEVVLKKQAVIGGAEVAILASVGRAKAKVFRRPTVSVLSTGSEIVEPGEPLSEGKIRNSNGAMLTGMAEALGCETRYLGIAEDSGKTLSKKVKEGLASDVFLLSGGVSMGEYDLVPEVLEAAHVKKVFHRVFIKPGKPLLFAKGERTIVFGVPGNPVSNFTTFHLFVKPALLKLMGREDHSPKIIDATSEIDFENNNKRVYVVPSFCTLKEGGVFVRPFTLNGSADITGCARANCLCIFEPGRYRVKNGDRVKLILL